MVCLFVCLYNVYYVLFDILYLNVGIALFKFEFELTANIYSNATESVHGMFIFLFLYPKLILYDVRHQCLAYSICLLLLPTIISFLLLSILCTLSFAFEYRRVATCTQSTYAAAYTLSQ